MRSEEPAILISTLLLQTHARLYYSLPLTRFLPFIRDLPLRMYGMQRTQFEHQRFDHVKLTRSSNVVYFTVTHCRRSSHRPENGCFLLSLVNEFGV